MINRHKTEGFGSKQRPHGLFEAAGRCFEPLTFLKVHKLILVPITAVSNPSSAPYGAPSPQGRRVGIPSPKTGRGSLRSRGVRVQGQIYTSVNL